MEQIDMKYLQSMDLPQYLINSICDLIKAEQENSSLWDCYYDDVYGSINGALHDNEISNEIAVELRKNFLGIK